MRVYDASRRHDYKEYEDVCETVQEFWGTGGGNVPIVVEYDGAEDIHGEEVL